MQVFHWNQPCNRPYDSRVGDKICRVLEKKPTKMLSQLRNPQHVSIVTGHDEHPEKMYRRGHFCTASGRNTTSPNPLTDQPDHKQTRRKDKQTSWEHVPDPS